MLRRVRLLPIFIFFAGLMLTLKLGSVWFGIAKLDSGVEVKTAQAQEKQSPPLGGPPAQDGKSVQTPTASTDEGINLTDPQEFSRSEVLILQELAERRKALDLRERQIVRREGLLKAAAQQLVSKQNELKQIRQEIKSLLGAVDKQEKDRLQNLVKIYENMKPKDAARIFNELDMVVLLGVVGQMKVRKVAPIIASMEVKKARTITRELAEQQKKPTMPK
jgi:flagellar motility protein MotE (MotC chaperone)